MAWIYAFGINIFQFLIWIASSFNPKAKLFYQGRKKLLEKIAREWTPKEKSIWFHFASLGEFEQGRPVLEEIRKNYPNEKIIITFFSPSGYEIRKNYSLADAVFYLPLDSPKNAEKFVELIRPKMAIFTKYEFWPNYFKALQAKQIPLFLISAIFRKEQAFFKFYGGFYREVLKAVNHFFVQNKESKLLLESIGFNQIDINGDTRLDSVYNTVKNARRFEFVDQFCTKAPILIAGSTWMADEKILATFLNQHPEWKCIIAPHEVNAAHIQELMTLFPQALRYAHISEYSAETINRAQILIIDTIGMLSSLYAYGQIAYIGGGFGAGIHNTLEAAAFGIPVVFGPKYQKFQEAKDLIAIGAARSIQDSVEFDLAIQAFYSENYEAGQAAADYVKNNRGATQMIMEKIKPYLDASMH